MSLKTFFLLSLAGTALGFGGVFGAIAAHHLVTIFTRYFGRRKGGVR